MPDDAMHETALLGGGCFWCLDAVFRELAGVVSVESGYAGGQMPNPSYEAVCEGDTGHAEVVRVTFDPTTPNRQGNDVGTQYRSVIFALDDAQREHAKRVIAELEAAHVWPNPIVTELAGPATFHPAEGYHQDYFERNPRQPYCAYVVAPKVAKFRKAYADRLRKRA